MSVSSIEDRFRINAHFGNEAIGVMVLVVDEKNDADFLVKIMSASSITIAKRAIYDSLEKIIC